MTLTQDDLQVLKRPFPLDDHEFHLGRAYIKEDAITERIEEIDPNWDTTKPDISWVEQFDVFQISVSLGLTIKGVTRYGVGSAVTSAQVRTNSQGKEYVTFDNEATKSAATDALKRAARLFGIGRYLLQAPKERDFARWLASLSGGQPATIQRTSPQPEARRVPPAQDDKPKNVSGHVLSIEKRQAKNGSNYMLVEVSGGHNAYVWSWSETFGLADYDIETDFSVQDGKIMPNRKIDVKLQLDENGYYNVSEIAPKS